MTAATGAGATGAGVAAVGVGATGAVAGAELVTGARLYRSCACFLARKARLRLVKKKIVVRKAVDLVRKFADPDAPNTVLDAPAPNDAPASAPLPCCSRIKPIMPRATKICTTKSSDSTSISSLTRH